MGVRRGAPLPDISSAEALRDTLLRASSIAYIDPAHGGTSGIHFAGVLRRLGIADAVSDKAVLWPGGSAAEAVVRGQAELVVHQMSEILAVEGVTLVGPLPPALQKVTTYAAGLSARSAAPEPARALIAVPRAPRAQAQARGRRPRLPGVAHRGSADTIDSHSRAAQSRSTGTPLDRSTQMSRARPDVAVPRGKRGDRHETAQ